MAKTYDRMRALLEAARDNRAAGDNARNLYELADYLSTQDLKEFQIDGEAERFLSTQAIRKLLRLLQAMGLVNLDGAVTLTTTGKQALRADMYDRMVSTAAIKFLASYVVTLASIHGAIESVSLPEVPESQVIFDRLTSPEKYRLGFERFRMILFLLYCTHKLKRDVKVLYGKRKTALK
jgi:hypothetical protein